MKKELSQKEYEEKVRCPLCMGAGTLIDEHGEEFICPECRGTGHILAKDEPVFDLDKLAPYVDPEVLEELKNEQS